MSFNWNKLLCVFVFTGLTLTFLTASAQTSPRRGGRPIQFSEPRSDVVSSNANDLRANQTALKELEQDLKKPFEFLSPANDPAASLTAPILPQSVPSAAKVRQMKEMLDRRNSWMLLEPEDYLKDSLRAEDLLEGSELGPDGALKPKKTAIEKFYENLDKARETAHTSLTNQLGVEKQDSDSKDERERARTENEFDLKMDSFRPTMTEAEIAATRRGSSAFSPSSLSSAEARVPKTFAEFFGFAGNEPALPAADQARLLEDRRQEVKDLLRGRLPGDSPVESASSFISSSLTPAPSLATPGFSSPSSFAPPSAPTTFSGAGSLGQLPGSQPATISPGLGNWQSPASATEAPRAVKLPAPGFQIPQRKF